jgi:hypothetical protein
MKTGHVYLRWGIITGVTVLGSLISAFPFALSAWVDPGFGSSKSLTSSLLTNVGTTLLLLAAVFLLERRFTRRLSEAAATGAKQAISTTITELGRADDRISAQLDALETHLRENPGR